jgi:hypothetical protein
LKEISPKVEGYVVSLPDGGFVVVIPMLAASCAGAGLSATEEEAKKLAIASTASFDVEFLVKEEAVKKAWDEKAYRC